MRRLIASIAVLIAISLMAACGPVKHAATRGCVIVDVSGSARPEITRMYLPGFQHFVERIADEGSGDVCFAFAAEGMTGGSSAWAHFSCTNPNDRLRCGPQVRASVSAAAAQLAAVAKGPNVLHGASQLLEALALVAPATRPGDELLMLSDAVQNSGLTGDFTKHATRLDAQGIDALLSRLQARSLLPDLRGRKLRIPYALTYGHKAHMSAARQQAIRAFWQRYAERTGAQLTFGGGDRAA